MGNCSLVDLSEGFVEKFFIKDPTPEAATDRSNELIIDQNLNQNTLSIVNNIVYNPEKIALATHRFGKLFVRRTEFCRSVGVHVADRDIHEFPVIKSGVNFWTQETIPVICMVIHSMPIKGRLDLLRSPHLKALRLDATIATYSFTALPPFVHC